MLQSYKNILFFRDHLPSPEDLKRKVLIKAKKLPPGKDETFEDVEEDDQDDMDEERRQKLSKVRFPLYSTAILFFEYMCHITVLY